MESVSVDEYLEALWALTSERGRSVRVRDISRSMKVAPPSVVQMIDKMRNNGLVRHDRRRGVSLTKRGERRARAVVRNHRLMEVLLVRVVGMDPDDIEHAVCGAEHYLSERSADFICTFLNHPEVCPHGDKIPRGECCPR
ncbi:MAG: metal-dependent transcriptional regulator [Candidatus Hadarchaeales archaeon]